MCFFMFNLNAVNLYISDDLLIHFCLIRLTGFIKPNKHAWFRLMKKYKKQKCQSLQLAS